MKKTLVTTAAVLALAGAAAAPAAANDCFRPAANAPTAAFTAEGSQPQAADSQAQFTASQTQAVDFQEVAGPELTTQSVTEAAAPVATSEVSPQGEQAASSSFSDAVAQEMLGMINDARAQAGAAPLSSNADLTGIASGWSQQMAASNSASHSPTFIDQTLATGSSNMAENVAYDVTSGKSAQETAQYFFNFWINSPGHHANIMNPEFNAIGFSLAESSNGYVYATQNFGTY